jgi:hypothetical protein
MQKINLQAKGLYTDPNLLSSVPEGALVQADNIIIERDNVIEPRRGFAKYGNTFGLGTDTAKQLLTYKKRLLVHYTDKLLYNSVVHDNDTQGIFFQFSGTYAETEPGRRIREVESNKNLYFTTADGIKKIAARTAADFTTSSGYIIDAGVYKALDLTGQLNFDTEGFLTPQSKIAYRIVWGYRDINDNLLLGTPSSRLVIVNYSDETPNVDLTFTIPTGLTSNYFYQIYRSAIFTVSGSLELDDIDPGDEMNLVYEDFPTSAQLTAGEVTVTDVSPEDFRQNGLPLYTNPSSGEGIGQANEPPPKAKDITMFQSTVFYANTEARANKTMSLLGVSDLISGTSSITITSGVITNTYTFVGAKEKSRFSFAAYSGTIPTDLDGKYFLLNNASNTRKYYVWFDNTKTTQKFDFSTYVGAIPLQLDGKYVIFHTENDRKYYLWYDSTGTTPDPGGTVAELSGLLGIRVDISSGVTTKAQVASTTSTALTNGNIFNDYDVVYTALNEYVEIRTQSFDSSDIEPIETLGTGFFYTITTPANNDPKNTPLVNTDVVGRVGFRVNVSRGITTKAQVADAMAASILDQDSALDFNVEYTNPNEYVDIENNNNGNCTDATDSLIDGIGSGFAITILNQGDGEDKALKHVLLSAAPTPSQQIDETARSLVNIINSNASEVVNAFYLSGPNDLPGQFSLQVKDIGVNTFTITANSASTGALFNPLLPPAVGSSAVEGIPEIKPNRIYFAKLQQPEAVPLLNFIDVGPEDDEISRILALRESLFILKTDGLYRLTGFNGNFVVDAFDRNCKIIAPDTAVVLNNNIYCLTNQGVAQISDTGVSIISTPLDNIFKKVTSSRYNYQFTSHGVGYETDRCYLLFLPTNENDTQATQCFRYNTDTTAWSRFLTTSKTCGIVNPADDVLYLGAGDENFVERERKNFDRTDYADRQFELTLPSTAVNGKTITLSQVGAAEVGDALVQTQYMKIYEYNKVLKKLDLDPQVGAKEVFTVSFASYVGSIPMNLHGKYFIMYSAGNAIKYVVFYDAIGNLQSIDTNVNTDAAGATQIRVNISSGVTTKAQLTDITKTTIQSNTLDFVITYTPGNEFFVATAVKSGATTDPSDSVLNPIGDGFSIVVNTQGFGDYFSSLEAFPGNNMKDKVDALALKFDNDPNITQNDFLSSLNNYSGVGATSAIGNPTVITFPAHGLQTGRMITITNSTNGINGKYIITRLSANTFSIPIATIAIGTLNFSSPIITSQEIQAGFNTLINKLNADPGPLFANYPQSEDSEEVEALILLAKSNSAVVEIDYAVNFVQGEITLYKGIRVELQYAPEVFGDPSMLKHVREGTFMFEDCTFSRGTVGYNTDVSPGIALVPFQKSGKGDWGSFVWGNQNWGGGFSGAPMRTYIPANKQRCRFIQAYFAHNSAREKWAIFGISYTLRQLSERAYRG